MTLGSLFDGAGGFPLAGTFAGFAPLWASEIEPFPIRVTTKRFPDMPHLGDIGKIKGADIPPVHVVTFGSPCQDLSVANGSRKGLEGERSGLFREAIRIMREMREATNGLYPAYAVWENVVGAFSSNDGEDFREVIEEIAKTADPAVQIPRPENGKWAKAEEWQGDGWSIAYRTYDAQFWGVPQRRRRIYLVADFRGGRAGKIQFERDRLRGDTAEGQKAGQGTAAVAERGAGAPSFPINAIAGTICARDYKGADNIYAEEGKLVLAAGFNGHKSITGNICYNEELSPCIETKMPPNVLGPIGILNGQGGSVMAVSQNTVGGDAHGGPESLTNQDLRVRRLTPLECCRLQGFPDFWAKGLETPGPSESEIEFWTGVFETHRLATNPVNQKTGRPTKPKARNQIIKWLKNPYSDSAEYKMWGNSLAVPVAYHVLAGIAEELQAEITADKPILDPCCGGRMFYFDKNNP